MIDQAMEAVILVGVWVGVWLEWRNLQVKERARLSRKFNALMKRIHSPISV